MLADINEKKPEREPIPAEVFNNLINAISNHEVKLLVMAYMAAQPTHWFSLTGLKHEMSARQGETPAWSQDPTTTFDYIRWSLEPIGAVVKGRVAGRDREVDAYMASEVGQKYGLAFAGELLSWSLEHSDISLQQIFGRTASTAERRSPQTRFELYESILTSGQAPSIRDITRSIDGHYPEANLEMSLRLLTEQGILEVFSTHQDEYNPTIQLDSTNMRVKNIINRSPESDAIHSVAHKLIKEGVTSIQLIDLYNAVCKAFPDIDPMATERRLTASVLNPTSRSFPELKVVDRGGIVNGSSYIKFSDNYKPAIEDLINRLETLSDGVNLDGSAGKAYEIISDKAKVRQLMAKAQKFSRTYRGITEGGSQELYDRITHIVARLGGITRKEINAQLEEEGKPFSSNTVSAALKKLVAQGTFNMTVQPPEPQKKRPRRVYELAEQN